MTIIALWMTFYAIDSAFASTRCVTLAGWTPSTASSDPANLCFAHRTFQPITAPFFHQNHLLKYYELYFV